MFNAQELQQLGYFLSKATIAGTESIAHAQLLVKIQNLLQQPATNKQERG
jgi:hypothetical protein